MSTLKAGSLLLLVMFWLVTPAPALAAGPYDGSTPLLCTMMTVAECDRAGVCERRTPESKDLPIFIKVDTGKRTFSALSNGDGRTSEIKSSAQIDGRLIL